MYSSILPNHQVYQVLEHIKHIKGNILDCLHYSSILPNHQVYQILEHIKHIKGNILDVFLNPSQPPGLPDTRTYYTY